jgi:hypothetical protein
MSNLKVICEDCDQPIKHECNADVKETLERLLSWVPEPAWASGRMEKAFHDESKAQDDEHDFREEPFFGSQGWSYLIFHKEDARIFHALIHNLIRAIGIDPHELEMQLYRAREKVKSEEAERKARVAAKKAARDVQKP